MGHQESNRARQPTDPIVPTTAHIVLNAAAVQKFGQGSFDFYFRAYHRRPNAALGGRGRHGHGHGHAFANPASGARSARGADARPAPGVKKFGKEAQGVAGLAQLLGVNPDVVQQTLQAYIDAAAGVKPDPFGKTVFPVPFALDDTFCASPGRRIAHRRHACRSG